MESALTLRERVALIQKELDLCLHLIDRLDKNPDDKDVKHRIAVEGAQVATFALGFRNECEPRPQVNPMTTTRRPNAKHTPTSSKRRREDPKPSTKPSTT